MPLFAFCIATDQLPADPRHMRMPCNGKRIIKDLSAPRHRLTMQSARCILMQGPRLSPKGLCDCDWVEYFDLGALGSGDVRDV